jgi:hypothetical protein
MRGTTAKGLRRAPRRAVWENVEVDGKLVWKVYLSEVRLLNRSYKKAKRGY